MTILKSIFITLAAGAALAHAFSSVDIAINCKDGEGTEDTTVTEGGFLGSTGCTPVGTQPYSDFQIRSVDIDDGESCFVNFFDFTDDACAGNTIARVGPFMKGDNGLACNDLGTDPITGASGNGGSVIVTC